MTKNESTILEIIEDYGSIDGSHHKQWVIDQIARVILGDEYGKWAESRREYDEEVDDDCVYYDWDTGIAP